MGGEHSPGMSGCSDREIDLSLSLAAFRAGGPRTAHPRDCRDSRAIRVSADPRPAETRGLVVHVGVSRLYKEMGLQLRNKTPKRQVKAKLREDRVAPVAGESWAMDFAHDQLATGQPDRQC